MVKGGETGGKPEAWIPRALPKSSCLEIEDNGHVLDAFRPIEARSQRISAFRIPLIIKRRILLGVFFLLTVFGLAKFLA